MSRPRLGGRSRGCYTSCALRRTGGESCLLRAPQLVPGAGLRRWGLAADSASRGALPARRPLLVAERSPERSRLAGRAARPLHLARSGFLLSQQTGLRRGWSSDAGMAASPARELTQNPLQKIWVPYNNGLPAKHSAQRGGEWTGAGAGGKRSGQAQS